MEHRCRIQSFCEWWRLAALLFIGIAVVVSIFLINLILENRHKGEAIAYSLILGGAMGNLIDRVFRGNQVAHGATEDRKSTRLNSSHVRISYAVFCLKKKKKQ